MLTKEKLIASINAMPEDEFSDIDILLERIVVLEKIEKGEKDIKEGKVFSTEEARQKLEKWLK
jgi:predicted transcriptional regulator